MNQSAEKRYEFISDAAPEDTFGVASWTGLEALSRPYEFDLLLASKRPDLDSSEILGKRARLVISGPEGETYYHGRPVLFEQGRRTLGLTMYRVRLVPWFALLANFHSRQVFLDQTLTEIFMEIIKKDGLEDAAVEFRLKDNYPSIPYICQYGESSLDFLNRLMERYGVYYFFEQTPEAEKMVVVDSMLGHKARLGRKKLIYSPPSGLEGGMDDYSVREFTCRVSRVPGKVMTGDYNTNRPGLQIQGRADVPSGGPGRVYMYGGNLSTPEEADALAKIKAQGLQARTKTFTGRSYISAISAGYLYELTDHHRTDFNAGYLIYEVQHQGRQTGPLFSGLAQASSKDEKKPFYSNAFRAIPAAVQYRPETKTVLPKAAGAVTAHVDASGSGKYAELDEQGRYKMKPAFDLIKRAGGKSSQWVRMAQPYAGKGGFHFPLHKKAEIILTHINGDPDRPIIAAALFNAENQSPVNSLSQAQTILRTGVRNQISMDDTEGSKSIFLGVPNNTTQMQLGTRNHTWWETLGIGVVEMGKAIGGLASSIWNANAESPGWQPIKDNNDGFALSTKSSFGKYVGQDLSIKIGGNAFSLLLGSEWTVVGGFRNRTVLGLCSVVALGGRLELHVPEKWTFCNVKAKTNEELLEMITESVEAANDVERAYDDKTTLAELKAEATNSRNQVAADKIRLVNDKIHAINSANEVIASKISAADKLMETANTKMRETGAEISAVDELVQAGNIKVGELQTAVRSAQSQIETVASLRAETQELKVITGEEVDL